jgi:serine/threonine protein kinase
MTQSATHCHNARLELLFTEDETSDVFRALVLHVDGCEHCQTSLSALAADADWWREAREQLHPSAEDAWKPDASWTSLLTGDDAQHQQDQHEQSLEVLGPPRHPEMLGRLGRYDIERVIGSGGMGIVLKAHDSELNRPIAIKVLAPHLAHVGAARERFAREGRAAAAVVHEHVVAIYNVETDGRVPFLVMQYVPGRSLQARVDQDGPLAIEELLRIGLQAASGLAAAHAQGLVHRDVKPSNILLEESVERAVLTDFGLARAIDDASLTHTGVLAGTPHYMSPEQASGEPIDHRSDLFSLGSVLYFMATGHPPFRADGALAVLKRICHDRQRSAWQSNVAVPDELSDLIDRLLEKRPGRRPPGAKEVAEQLSTLLSRLQTYGPSRRLWPWRRRTRNRGLTILAAALAIAATATGVTLWPGSPPPLGDQVETTATTVVPSADAVTSDAGFGSELSMVRQDAQELEGDTVFLPAGDDAWQREVELLHYELSRIESRYSHPLEQEEQK